MQKKALTVAIASALVIPIAAQAVEVQFSGQVNRAIMYVDTGPASDVQHVDNNASGSRIRWVGSQDMGNGMKAGVNWEIQFQSNTSAAAAVKSTADLAPAWAERQQNVWFSGAWGKLTVGQTDGAGNGSTERDLSGTFNASYSGRGTWGGGVTFRTAGGGTSGITVGAVQSNFDALSRYDVLRYDTPTLGPGIVLSASDGNNETWEIAGSLNTAMAGGKIAAAIHYADSDNRAGYTSIGGSASFLFSQGTSITVAYAERDMVAAGVADPENLFIKLGHKFGPHAVSIDWSETEDLAATGNEAQAWSIGWAYTIAKPKVDLYAVYRNYDFDDTTGASYQDIDLFAVGSRIRF